MSKIKKTKPKKIANKKAIALSQASTPIWSKVKEYSNRDIAHFDVPGHKKKDVNDFSNTINELFKYDQNSSPELDFLLEPLGVIHDSLDLLSSAFSSDESLILTNGTTQGIQLMIISNISDGDKVIVPINSHKSVINSIVLAGGIPIFIETEYDKFFDIHHNVSIDTVKKTIVDNPDAKAIVVLNPTYFGVVADLKEIVKVCKENNILVLCDEAHGAHFHFSKKMPISAMEAKADISAVSLHKTLGSLTQSSALIWREENIKSKHIYQFSGMLFSTSPSYLLMSSVDCARSMFATNGEKLISNALEVAKYAKEEIKKIDNIDLMDESIINGDSSFAIDPTKIVFKVSKTNITGFEFYEELRLKGIQIELAHNKTCMAVITFADTKESIDKLVKGIKEVANKKRRTKRKCNVLSLTTALDKAIFKMTPREAISKQSEEIKIKDALGRVSSDNLLFYPPGIPLLIPGQEITQGIIDKYMFLKKHNAKLVVAAKDSNKILVIKD